MNSNLVDYIKVYKGFINKELCEQTVLDLNNATWEPHNFAYVDEVGNVKNLGKVSGEKELEVSNDLVSTHFNLMQRVWDGLDQYIRKDFKFTWFDGWSGYSHIRYNRYVQDRLMAKHCDHIQSLFDGEKKGIPILSIVGLLNDDFMGGEFVMFDDHVVELEAGDLLIFPSVFLYPHKVNPIKSGIRYSFVSWAW